MEKIPHPVISKREYSNYTIPPLTLLEEESVKSFNETLNVINDNGEKLLLQIYFSFFGEFSDSDLIFMSQHCIFIFSDIVILP